MAPLPLRINIYIHSWIISRFQGGTTVLLDGKGRVYARFHSVAASEARYPNEGCDKSGPNESVAVLPRVTSAFSFDLDNTYRGSQHV